MKKILALFLTVLMLLASCGPAATNDTTLSEDITGDPTVTDSSDSNEGTDPTVTEPAQTEPPVKVDREDYKIEIKEDTYVFDKNSSQDYSDQNFSTVTTLVLKTGNKGFTRYVYLKYDISSLVGDNDFTAIEADLYLLPDKNDFATSTIEVYGCSSNCDLSTLTFNTQPKSLGFICSLKGVTPDMGSISIPITDFVRYALQKGETEIVLMLKEVTLESLPVVTFIAKEKGENASQLSVYYGTKVDSNLFIEGGDSLGEPEISQNGLDAIFGQQKLSNITYPSIEDTYVRAGDYGDKNFGGETLLDFKGTSQTPTDIYRVSLLKFDIEDISAKDEGRINLSLYCSYMETASVPVTVHLYSCDPWDWNENSVTYNTIPEREELITSVSVSNVGWVKFDITDYIKECRKHGKKTVSFLLEGDQASFKRLKFNSKENKVNNPRIEYSFSDINFTTYLKYKEHNPWQVAMDGVTEWLARWEEIKSRGDYDTVMTVRDSAEYSISVDAAKAADTSGYNTQYTAYPTRTISTLKGYKANTSEVAKYDEYGGLMDESMKQEATGFFYVKKIGDRWWNIDPLGYPMFRASVTSVGMGSPLQTERLLAKYGSNENWAQATNDRLRELGFNSFGGFTGIGNFSSTENVLTLTNILSLMSGYTTKIKTNVSDSGSTKIAGDMIPAFDPDFASFAESKIASAVTQYADSADVYGWMSDNELPHSKNALDNALQFYCTDQTFIYSYAVAWTFMYLKTGKADVSLADVTDELRYEFVAMLFDKYFSVVEPLFKKYDPNHMYMGCRFHSNAYKTESIMRVAGYWCDVITYNYYGEWTPNFELVSNQIRWAGKPFVVTEWYAKGMDVWENDNRMTNESGAGWTVRTQDDRGKFYQNFALALLECKGCVGFDWFKYIDNDPDNLKADLSNRNANKGIIDNYGEEYYELTSYMSELNHQKYNLIKFFDAR